MFHNRSTVLTLLQSKPAHSAGLFGFKPTIGLVPCSDADALPISSLHDCFGPFGKTAWDLAAVLSVIIPTSPSFVPFVDKRHATLSERSVVLAPDAFSADAASFKEPFMHHPTEALKTQGRDLWEEIKRLLAPALKTTIDTETATIMQSVLPQTTDSEIPSHRPVGRDDFQRIFSTEGYNGINAHLATRTGPISSLEDIVQWNNDHPVSGMWWWRFV